MNNLSVYTKRGPSACRGTGDEAWNDVADTARPKNVPGLVDAAARSSSTSAAFATEVAVILSQGPSETHERQQRPLRITARREALQQVRIDAGTTRGHLPQHRQVERPAAEAVEIDRGPEDVEYAQPGKHRGAACGAARSVMQSLSAEAFNPWPRTWRPRLAAVHCARSGSPWRSGKWADFRAGPLPGSDLGADRLERPVEDAGRDAGFLGHAMNSAASTRRGSRRAKRRVPRSRRVNGRRCRTGNIGQEQLAA